MKHWYAIHTKPRQETNAAEQLRRQAFEVFLPTVRQPRRSRGRLQQRSEALFPRYLFVCIELGTDDVAPIRSTRGVSNVVSFGGPPAVVPEPLVEALMQAADRDTGLLNPQPELFQPGAPVTIIDGPLAGLKAIFDARNGDERSFVLLDILGKTQHVAIDNTHIWPAHLD